MTIDRSLFEKVELSRGDLSQVAKTDLLIIEDPVVLDQAAERLENAIEKKIRLHPVEKPLRLVSSKESELEPPIFE